MNIHSCSSKTNYTNKFSIPKLCENSPFHNSNVTHASRNDYKVTFTFMENQVNSLNNIDIMKVDEHTFMPSKTNYTNKLCIPKLCSNSLFHNSNVTHASRNNYQGTFTFMENQRNSLNNTEIMQFNEHTFMLIKN